MPATLNAAFDALAAAIHAKDLEACKAVVTGEFARGKELTQEVFDGMLARWEKDLGEHQASLLERRPALGAPDEALTSVKFAWTYSVGEEAVMAQSKLSKTDGEWKLDGLRARCKKPFGEPGVPGPEAAPAGAVLAAVVAAVEGGDFEAYAAHMAAKRGQRITAQVAKELVARQDAGCGGQWLASLSRLPALGAADDSLTDLVLGMGWTSAAGPIETGVALRKTDGAWQVTDIDVNAQE